MDKAKMEKEGLVECESCGSGYSPQRGIVTRFCISCRAKIDYANTYIACRKCGKVYQYRSTRTRPQEDKDLCPWCKAEIDGIFCLYSFDREKECYTDLVRKRIEDGWYANHKRGPLVCEQCGFGASELVRQEHPEGEHGKAICRYCAPKYEPILPKSVKE